MQTRAHADVEREGQRAVDRRGLVEIELEVPARVDVDVQRVPVLDHEALDRGIANAVLGIERDHHAGIEIGPAVLERVDRDRQLGEIDRFLRDLEDRAALDHDRRPRALLPGLDAVGDVLGERALLPPHELRKQLARPVESGEDGCRVPLDPLEEDGARAAFELRREAGEIVLEVDLGADAHQPPERLQVLDDRREIADMAPRHPSLPGDSADPAARADPGS